MPPVRQLSDSIKDPLLNTFLISLFALKYRRRDAWEMTARTGVILIRIKRNFGKISLEFTWPT